MANAYTQLHIQAVFAVQNRDCILRMEWKGELYRYRAVRHKIWVKRMKGVVVMSRTGQNMINS